MAQKPPRPFFTNLSLLSYLKQVVLQPPRFWLQHKPSRYNTNHLDITHRQDIYTENLSVIISFFGSPGSGSGPFYHQAKFKKNLDSFPTVLWLFHDFLSLKNDVNVPSKVISRKTISSMRKTGRSGAGYGSISQGHGSADPDPYKNVTDPQHWLSSSPKPCPYALHNSVAYLF
jgi:hypothetical protein